MNEEGGIRGEYSRFIDGARRAVVPPHDLVSTDGTCVFGTFDREFESMDLVRVRKPTHAPQCMNRLKLTLWEATEVHLEEGLLVAAICDMGIFGKVHCLFYDKRTGRVFCWDVELPSKQVHITPNLLDGAVAEAHADTASIRYENQMVSGCTHLTGCSEGVCLENGRKTDVPHTIEYDFQLKRVSLPSVVSIPFGSNRPLYSQKDLFEATGYLVLDGERMVAEGDRAAIIDDHRGFYPRHAHYDWVSTMGLYDIEGRKRWFGLNLTHNQSIDPVRYNENLIWLEGATSLLPPVTFTREPECAGFNDHAVWIVRDEQGMVDLRFDVRAIDPTVTHALVVNIDYYFAFGQLSGYVRDEMGRKYLLDGMLGMGEDKTLLL